jgi:glutaredoxin
MKKWTIHPKVLEKLYPLLYKHTETGGKFTFPVNKKGVVERVTSVTKFQTTNGASDSVRAPEGLANFHTHPFSCYVSEGCVYGFFSGEDVRETILFAMKGSLVHLVLAVEGVYSLQINPCVLTNFIHLEPEIKRLLPKLKSSKPTIMSIFDQYSQQLHHPSYDLKPFLKSKGVKSTPEGVNNYLTKVREELENWGTKEDSSDNVYLVDFLSDIIRGVIVLYIEIYYRASHRFRAHDVNTNPKNALYPIDFVKFINSFKISNIFNTGKKVQGCGNLSCGGVPVYEDGKRRSSKFANYVSDYEKDTGFYLVSKRGETYSLNMSLNNLMKLSKHVKDINVGGGCGRSGNGKHWFHMTFAPNYVDIKGKKLLYISKRLTADNRKEFIKYWSEHVPGKNETPVTLKSAPVFYYYTIKGDCDHTDINNHLIDNPNRSSKRKSKRQSKRKSKRKSKKIIMYGSDNCGWCKRAANKFKSKGVKITKRYFDSIYDAITNASRYSVKHGGKEIKSIPAIFVNGEYNNSVKKVIKNVTNN